MYLCSANPTTCTSTTHLEPNLQRNRTLEVSNPVCFVRCYSSVKAQLVSILDMKPDQITNLKVRTERKTRPFRAPGQLIVVFVFYLRAGLRG